MIIGEMIKEIRENAGLSQEQFAEKLAVSRQAVSKWERRVAMLDIENIMYISNIFNVSLDTIIKGDKNMENKLITDSKNAKFGSKLLIGLLLTAIAVLAFTLNIGTAIYRIFDPRAIMIMVIFPLLFQYIMYGKFSLTAFSIIFNKEKNGEEAWKKAEGFFNNYAAVWWLTAIIFLAINFIMLLRDLESIKGIGPHILFMANTVLIAALISLIVTIPYKVRIKHYFIQMKK
jgi:transcriptional regulator with XRE-family HTH domain